MRSRSAKNDQNTSEDKKGGVSTPRNVRGAGKSAKNSNKRLHSKPSNQCSQGKQTRKKFEQLKQMKTGSLLLLISQKGKMTIVWSVTVEVRMKMRIIRMF